MSKHQKEETVPRLTDFPGYAAAKEKLDQLRQQHQELDHLLNTGALYVAKDERKEVDALAMALLETGQLPAGSDPDLPARRERKARADLKILARAIERQKQAVDDLVRQASKEICKALEPAHKKIVARMCDLIFSLLDLNEVELALRESISNQGMSCTLPVLLFSIAGLRRDSQSMGVKFLEECTLYGYLDAGDPRMAELLRLQGRTPR